MSESKSGNMPRVRRREVKNGRLPLRVRLKAWWEGYDVRVPQPKQPKPAPDPAPAPSHEVRAPEPEPLWTDTRITLAQEVWGQGLDRPGDHDYVVKLCAPFGLDSSMSVLDVGAGLGGGTRALCRAYGCWMTGMEPDDQLAQVGHNLSVKAGLPRKAPIYQGDLEDPDLKPRGYDRIFSKETFFQVQDKPKLLDALEETLKPGGQLLFTDYVVLDSTEAEAAEIKRWREKEDVDFALYSVDDYKDALKDRKLQIPIAEDVTDQVVHTISSAWESYLERAKDDESLKDLAELANSEADLWARRQKALESGHLRVYRFHALKKDENLMLSDW